MSHYNGRCLEVNEKSFVEVVNVHKVLATVVRVTTDQPLYYLACTLEVMDGDKRRLCNKEVEKGICKYGHTCNEPAARYILPLQLADAFGSIHSVERLPKSPKALADTSFLDLLLDRESRESFVFFLQSDQVVNCGSVPPGLKISLQGAEGPVSLDIFRTRGDGYYLCALQEEPGQYPVPPDAEPSVVMPKSHQHPSSSTSSGTSKEVAAAAGELRQVLLVVNDETPAMDIEEVTLSFFRRSRRDKMPTLRQFMRVNDWERLQPIFDELKKGDQAQTTSSRLFPYVFLVELPTLSTPRRFVSMGLADESTPENLHTFERAQDFDLESSFDEKHDSSQRWGAKLYSFEEQFL